MIFSVFTCYDTTAVLSFICDLQCVHMHMCYDTTVVLSSICDLQCFTCVMIPL